MKVMMLILRRHRERVGAGDKLGRAHGLDRDRAKGISQALLREFVLRIEINGAAEFP